MEAAAADAREVDSEVEALHGEAEPAESGEDGDDESEEFRQTAPIFPWELMLRQSQTFFQRLPSGAMQVKFCPAFKGPNGRAVPMPPGIVVEFGIDAWERFKKAVAADGEAPPEIQTATILPPGVARG